MHHISSLGPTRPGPTRINQSPGPTRINQPITRPDPSRPNAAVRTQSQNAEPKRSFGSRRSPARRPKRKPKRKTQAKTLISVKTRKPGLKTQDRISERKELKKTHNPQINVGPFPRYCHPQKCSKRLKKTQNDSQRLKQAQQDSEDSNELE